MATPANPMLAARQGMAFRGPGGNPMGGPMGPSGFDPSSTANAVAQQLSELRGADPEAGLKELQAMQQKIISFIPQYAMRIPKRADGLTAAMKAISKAIDAFREAQNVMSTMGGGPLGSSAVSPNPMPGANPGMGGPMPGPSSPTMR